MRSILILTFVLILENSAMAFDRRDVRDYTGRKLGWVTTDANGWERAYNVNEGLMGWYNPNSGRTYRFDGTIYSFGNRVDKLIGD